MEAFKQRQICGGLRQEHWPRVEHGPSIHGGNLDFGADVEVIAAEDAMTEHPGVEGSVGAHVLVSIDQPGLTWACLGLKVEEWSREALNRCSFRPMPAR